MRWNHSSPSRSETAELSGPPEPSKLLTASAPSCRQQEREQLKKAENHTYGALEGVVSCTKTERAVRSVIRATVF